MEPTKKGNRNVTGFKTCTHDQETIVIVIYRGKEKLSIKTLHPRNRREKDREKIALKRKSKSPRTH